jgi:hypothetical protein
MDADEIRFRERELGIIDRGEERQNKELEDQV